MKRTSNILIKNEENLKSNKIINPNNGKHLRIPIWEKLFILTSYVSLLLSLERSIPLTKFKNQVNSNQEKAKFLCSPKVVDWVTTLLIITNSMFSKVLVVIGILETYSLKGLLPFESDFDPVALQDFLGGGAVLGLELTYTCA